MNLSEQLESFLTSKSMAVVRLVKAEAEQLGLPLYIVGGSVRDLLLGRAIKDFDFTVEGDAANFAEALLRNYAGRVVFHHRFGTATWTLDESTFKRVNVPLLGTSEFPPFMDLISARSETYSHPGALPAIQRSTIDDDLRRRDFSINAMALRLDGKYYGELVDPLGGQADLKRGLIRVLHDRSFIDDPTRMLRAVRYAGRYEFEIEPKTLGLIHDEAKAVLSRLSGERLRHEIDLIFEEKNRAAMLNRLAGMDLLRPIHPALQFTSPLLPLPDETPDELGPFAKPDSLSFKQTLGWILWLMPLPVPDIEEIAKRLDFPAPLAAATRAAASLFADLPSFSGWKPSQWTFHLDDLPALAVYAVFLVTANENLRDYLSTWRNIKPAINGNHLKQLGLEPGPRFAEILRRLRSAWLDGEVRNEMQEKSLLNRLIDKIS
jgi:tRNA nucleotidyltransferase (CCA-adding enzyme)